MHANRRTDLIRYADDSPATFAQKSSPRKLTVIIITGRSEYLKLFYPHFCLTIFLQQR